MRYKITSTGQCIIADQAFMDAHHAGDYEQLADEPTPVSIPQAVTMRQARLALLAAGKLALIAPAIAAMPEPQQSAANIEWEYSNEVQRNNSFVGMLGAALGMTSTELDALFVAAAAL